MNFSQDDAKYLLAGFGVLIPFVIAWLPTIKIPDYGKFGILALLSLVGGFLTAYTTGTINWTGSIVQNGATILTAAQVFYYGAFRVLGLEKVLFPQQAVATQVKEQAKVETPDVSTALAKAILDPSEPPAIDVKANVVNQTGDVK